MTTELPRQNYVVAKIIKLIGPAGFASGYTEITRPQDLRNELAPTLLPSTTEDIRGLWKITALSLIGGGFCDLSATDEIQNSTGVRPDGKVDISRHPNGLIYKLTLQNPQNQTLDIFYFDPDRDLIQYRITNRSTIKFVEEAPGKADLQLFAGNEERTTGILLWKRTSYHALRPAYPVKCYRRSDIEVT